VSIKLVTPGKTDIRKIWVENKEETFELPIEEKPLLVRFDEDNILIKEISFPKELDELLYQLKHDDVIGRMDAAQALVTFRDDPRTAAALTASLRSDPFWAVRKSALEALAQLEVKGSTAIFKRACQDQESQVRAAALVALGNLKVPAHIEFYKELFRTDPSYLVQAEALTAIGKTGDPSTVPFLKKAAEVPSYRHMIRRAAEDALKLIEKK
jgi:aminopeptidase N